MIAIDRLIEQIKNKNNPTVVGLDPRLEAVPEFIKESAFSRHGQGLKAAAEAVLEFNTRLIDAVYDLIPAVKPQIAFYEMLGVEGMRVFKETCEYARSKKLLVIGDVKRGDIGSTAEAYSSAYLGKTAIYGELQEVFDIDFITVNPYLGGDSVEPFIKDCERYGKGIFLLVKTSNKTSGDLQDITTSEGRYIFELVAEHVNKWGERLIGANGYSSVGAVIGATYPDQLIKLRNTLTHAYILVPGYGTQGGTAADAACAFKEDGLGAIVNASRSISSAYASQRWKADYSAREFDQAARAEVIHMRDELNNEIAAMTAKNQNMEG